MPADSDKKDKSRDGSTPTDQSVPSKPSDKTTGPLEPGKADETKFDERSADEKERSLKDKSPSKSEPGAGRERSPGDERGPHEGSKSPSRPGEAVGRSMPTDQTEPLKEREPVGSKPAEDKPDQTPKDGKPAEKYQAGKVPADETKSAEESKPGSETEKEPAGNFIISNDILCPL